MSSPRLSILQNDRLYVSVLAEEGGRVASLRSADTGLEFLLQPQHPRTLAGHGFDVNFSQGFCAGVEECLPSVGACGSSTHGGPVPDHGDFWQLPWHIEQESTAEKLQMHATGFSRPLQFRKQMELRGSSLHIEYDVMNLSDRSTSFLYACHPLLAVDAGDRIVLPDEVSALRLYYSRDQRLGAPGDIVAWPLSASTPGVDLSRVLPYSAGTGDMLYTSRLRKGWCGIYRSSMQQGIILRFDTALLRYLGLWLCYGGWPDNGVTPLQYAVALEPTVAPCGTLQEAQEQKIAIDLAPSASFRWSIDFQVTLEPLSFEEFHDRCAHQQLYPV